MNECGDLTGKARFQRARNGAAWKAAVPVSGAAAKMAAVPVRAGAGGDGDLTGKARFQRARNGAAWKAAVPVSAGAGGDGDLTGKARFQRAAFIGTSPCAKEFAEAIRLAHEHFSSRFGEIMATKHNLRHWGQSGVIVFITFRLADSLPSSVLTRWTNEKNEWLANHPEPWSPDDMREYAQRFSNQMEKWLDAGYGECILSREDCRQIVAEAFEHFNGSRYALHSYIVMPNHVHVLVELMAKEDMPKILHGWKSYTASAINRVLGRAGSVWQRDYFDRLVRNADHYGRCLAYIRKNESAARKLWGEGK